MTNHEKILSHVPKMLLDHQSFQLPYKVSVRPSSLPYCQTQYLFSKIDPITVSVGDSFMERIFVTIGSAAHGVAQTYLGRAGVLYGNWKCKKCYWTSSPHLGTPYCGEKRLEWTRGEDKAGNLIGPDDAPCGKGLATRYQEFAVTDTVSGLKGSCDGLLIVAGNLYLLEIKTRPSGWLVSKMEKPPATHYAQATTYAEMIQPSELGLDMEVAGVAFCYVPRDFPHKMKFIYAPRDDTCLKEFRKDLPETFEILENGNIEDARVVCPNEKYAKKTKYCDYAGQCFRPDRVEYLKRLWENNNN